MRHEPCYPDFHGATWAIWLVAGVLMLYEARWYLAGAVVLAVIWTLL